MKAPEKLISIFNKLGNRGIALIYIALLLVALFAFVGLAIDIGYMYVTKTQLQNAADSAALAGASQMKSVGTGTADPNDLVQSEARTQAILFAAQNTATKVPIVISNDGTNTLSDSNDITVGHWDGASYAPNSTPVNAIQARARRTDTSPGGPVSLFIGRVFGQNTMGAAADAIATLPLRANSFISFCTQSCTGISTDPSNPTVLDPVRVYDTRPPSQTPGNLAFAWTSLLNPVTSASDISPMICTESPNEAVCGKPIYTTQGQVTSVLKDLEAVFNDPNYDRENKEFSGNKVSAWWVIVPVVEECNPGNQPEPHTVLKYALIRIISACDTGGGTACRPYRSQPCTNSGAIVVDQIACIDCANINNSSGSKTVLVK